ncbi:hypothetical protein AB0H18_25790 [Streptomyces sp. NPDC020766]|uniref:hypothetical protein n=1 Tax=Streptomyces sp. NPDC020766 TaxID=3155011 RepID=UPI0033E4E301
MSTNEGFAARSADALRELGELDGIEIETRPSDPSIVLPSDSAEVRAALSEYIDPSIAAGLQEYYFPAEELHVSWNSTGDPRVDGELCLINIHTCLTRWQPPLEDVTLTSSEQSVLADLKVMDQEPFAGTGRATGLRVTSRSQEPEVWFYDLSRSRLDRLDLDYGTYMETALVMKGAFGWQYLFTDVELERPEFHEISTNLTEALALFSMSFPEYAYADLRNRLEARQ